jgi:hypothetical protein
MPIGEELMSLAFPRIQLDTEPPEKDYTEIGVDLNLPFSSTYRNQWEIQREDDVSVQKLVAMRENDGQARALYRLITLPILSALKGFSVIPFEGKEGGKDEADFIHKVLSLPPHVGGMEISLRKVMAHLLLGIFDGFSASELVIHAPEFGPLKDKWTIAKIAPRPSETLTFVVDGKGRFKGLRQRAYVNGKTIDVLIPKERALVYTCQEEEVPYYGRSMFKTAFFHWDVKSRLYHIAHVSAQRNATGTRIATYPKAGADPKSVRGFTKSVADMSMNGYIIKREGYEVESIKEGGSFDFLGMINHHDAKMSASVLATFFDENQGAGQNDGKLVDFGQQSDALFQLLLDTIIGDLEDLVNHKIIPKLINWNFGNEMYPTFKWGQVSKDERAMTIELFKNLMATANQGNVSDDFVFESERLTAEALGYELDYDTIKREREAEKAEMKEQEKKTQAMNDEMMALQMEQQKAAMQAPTTSATGAALDQPLDIPGDLLPEGLVQ